MYNSGNTISRGSATPSPDMPPLPQCLPLDPIVLGNQKYTRSGELRRVLGVGSTAEDNSFGLLHPKPSPPVATEELKHFKDSVQDTSRKARDRAKLLRESILKLDKYRDALSTKKRQRSDFSSSERSSGVNLVKMGTQTPRNSNDTVTHRLEDRTKSIGLNKRVRTSAVDLRVDSRSAANSRQQMVTDKDGDLLHAVSGGSVRIEEKTRRLLAGGEGLDQKIKKKRSVGAVGNRLVTGEWDTKRATHPKLNADSKLRSCDSHGFRLKSSPGVGGINKLDSYEPASSDSCTVVRNELDRATLPRERTVVLEQKLPAKGNNKSNIQDDIPVGSPNTVVKGKVSRTPRTGSVMGLDSSPNIYHSSGAFQGWEQGTGLNKVPVVGATNNQRRMMSTGSSMHPMTQWVGQRPHKNSRTRRANLVSPVSNNAEAQIASQGLASTDFSAKLSSAGTNGPLPSSSIDNNTPKVKREYENVSSPFGLSESEESGAVENKIKGKGLGNGGVALAATHKAGTFVLPTKKNKMLSNEIGDGVERQGRNGRGSSLTRPGVPPAGEKLENISMTKPPQSVRTSSEKNRSKSGRPPSKKLKDRKASIRVGPIISNGSSNFTGESDDDGEELFMAANAARNASSLACSGPFWKKMESIFASVSSEDLSYLKQQLGFAEELDGSLSQMFGVVYNVLGVGVLKGEGDCSGVGQKIHPNQEIAETDSSHRTFDMRKLDTVTPLYQRVLSALIEEDEVEEFYHHSEGKSLSLQYASDDSHCGSCNQIDIEPKDWDKMEPEVESNVDYETPKNYLLDRLSCDKSVTSNSSRNLSMSSSLHTIEQWRGDDEFSQSDLGHASEICSNELVQLQPGEPNDSSSSSSCQYQLLCLDDRLLLELQSIGLYPESLPTLAEGEVINQELELKEGLHKQIGIKRKSLGKIHEAIRKGRDSERRKMEEVAMDQLIEMAHRKRMACRRSCSSKSAVRKVSKQVALAFVKRTLARCRNFEDTGNGCFSEPALQDVIFSLPPCNNDAKSVDCVGSGTASNTCNEASHQGEARGSATGAVSSASQKYDSLSDNVDRGSSDALQSVIRSSEQASSKLSFVPVRGKKREMLIDDVVGSPSSRVMSSLDSPVLGGLKGKRTERDRAQNRDNLRSNSVPGRGRSSLDSFPSERKTKAKHKQKNSHLSTSGCGSHGRSTEAIEPTCPLVRGSSQEVGMVGSKINPKGGSRLPSNIPQESSKEVKKQPVPSAKLQPSELDPMEALGVSNELDGHQDLSSWLNFDEDGLQDHDSIGLEIPMDDLSEILM